MQRPIRLRVARHRCLHGLARLTAILGVVAPALAQEPLFLRIRPAGDTPDGLGRSGPSDDEIARAARARSEAVWQRAEQRSRIAIASVCTGCLATPLSTEPSPRPTPPLPVRPDPGDLTSTAADPKAAPIPPIAQADSP